MKLQVFLYLLVRDELSFGTIEKLVAQIELLDKNQVPPQFSEPFIAEWASSIARRLS
jgi:hypothetical protein